MTFTYRLKTLGSCALIGLNLLTLNLLNPAVGMEALPSDVTYDKVKSIIDGHLTRYPDLLDSSKDKDIVVFLGNSGAGKSTTLNYLSGKELQADMFNKIVLENPDDPSALPIGGGDASETFLPNFLPIGDLVFYDLPGFGDTRGTAQNLVNACFIKRIIENARSTRFVFVAGIGQVTEDRGASFKKLARQVRQLVPDKSIENLSGLIVTKSHIEKEVLPSFLNTSLDLGHPDLSLIGHWLASGKVDQIPLPRDGQINYEYRNTILSLIRSMGHEQVESVDIGVIYDTEQEREIKTLYDAELDDIIDTVLADNGCGLNLLSGHSLRFLGASPTPDAFRYIQPGELGVFWEQGKLYGKAYNKETREITNLTPESFERIKRSLQDPFNLNALNAALQGGKGRKQALAAFNGNIPYESVTVSDLEALLQETTSCGYTLLPKDHLQSRKHYLINGFQRNLTSALENSSLVQVLRPISEGLYQSAFRTKSEESNIRIQNLVASLNEEIAKQERQAEAVRRIQAEHVSQAEEARRIEAERAEQAERDRREFAEQRVAVVQQQVANLQQQVNNMASNNRRNPIEQTFHKWFGW